MDDSIQKKMKQILPNGSGIDIFREEFKKHSKGIFDKLDQRETERNKLASKFQKLAIAINCEMDDLVDAFSLQNKYVNEKLFLNSSVQERATVIQSIWESELLELSREHQKKRVDALKLLKKAQAQNLKLIHIFSELDTLLGNQYDSIIEVQGAPSLSQLKKLDKILSEDINRNAKQLNNRRNSKPDANFIAEGIAILFNNINRSIYVNKDGVPTDYQQAVVKAIEIFDIPSKGDKAAIHGSKWYKGVYVKNNS